MARSDTATSGNEGDQVWAFDLDALRKAFGQSVQEHKITASDWAEHAKQFLEKQRDRPRKPT